jgi:predicted regulator of amino acid metabolism with ACT domain
MERALRRAARRRTEGVRVETASKRNQLRGLWPSIEREFSRQSSRLLVVRKMLEYGIRVSDEGKLFVGGMEVDYSSLARDADTDRRVVKQTAEQIRDDPFLFSIFSGVAPVGASLLHVVSSIGCSAIIIEADPRAAGIISKVTGVLARHGIVVRQALADDPDMVKDAHLTLIVEGAVGGSVIGELEELEMVRGITVRK